MNKPARKMPDSSKPSIPNNNGDPTILQTPLQRRKFLGMSLLGFAGLALPSIPVLARKSSDTLNGLVTGMASGPEKAYWDRTERFEEKMKMLQSAWDRKDYRTVRALTNSLRNTCIQAQSEDEKPGTPVSGSSQYGKVDSLPAPWKTWAKGWNYYKTLVVAGTEKERKTEPGTPVLGYPLTATATDQFVSNEPIEVLLAFPSAQVSSLSREIRVARIDEGMLKEVTSQVFGELRRGKELFCQLLFMAESKGATKQTFLVFYGNPDAELPAYPTDLVTTGEDFGLDIDNDFFKVSLSKQHGQIERMTLKREHGLNLYAGGDGHGEPPGIDWAHDYVTEGSFQKLRVSLWDKCPDFEVVRGPICTIVRRWGFPYSPVHPVFSPSRLNVDVEYRFYAGLPYFQKSAHMTALKNFDLAALRDDEWVFTGQPFTDMMWMGPDGKLKIGEVDKDFNDTLWGIGFFNKDNRDSFVGLFLEHSAEGMPEPRHSGSPTLYYKWHGSVWSRYPIYGKDMPAGAVLHEKNVYVSLPFTTTEGPAVIEELRHRLKNPLGVSFGTIQNVTDARGAAISLARPGEAGDSLISKKLLWEALKNCKDPQFYTADISIVDLGLVYDIIVRGNTVKVILAMPHRGRPLATYFVNGSNSVHNKVSMNIHDALRKVPGVREVVMEQSWYPGWTSNLLTEEGRNKLGL